MVEERIYTIPLRKEFLKVPRWRRSKKAVSAVKTFLKKHMKDENVKLGAYLNKEILKRGMKRPPARVKVKVWKDGEIVRAELVGAPVKVEKPKKKEPKEEKEEEKKDEEVEEEKEKRKPEVSESEKALKEVEVEPRREERGLEKRDEEKLRMQKIITDSRRKGHKREKR